jgi:hypothetical protein
VFDFFSSIIDLLKASRRQTGAIALTAGLFLYLSNLEFYLGSTHGSSTTV